MKKIALVTGANRGLGKAVCQQLLEKGYTTILTARDAIKGEATMQELKMMYEGADIHFKVLDTSQPAQFETLAKDIQQQFGKIDVLVNNAAVMHEANTSDIQEAELKQVIQTNVYGPLFFSQSMHTLLSQSDDARIVNVSSGMGALHSMKGGHFAYRLSKTALNSITAIMASDWSAQGIKTFAVCPGWVKTDMGGAEAPRSLEQGASSITYPIFNQVENGRFYRDGELLEW